MAQSREKIRPPPGAAGSCRACPRDGSVFTEGGVARAYLTTDRAGATPRRLRVLLYGGAIRLCRQGLEALDAGRGDLAADKLARAGRIVEQLRRDLPGGERDERLRHFDRLYEQVARRLVEAGFYQRREPLSETISLLNCSRSEWDALARSPAGAADASPAGSASWVG